MAATAILLEKLISTIYNKISERTLENYETKNREIKIKNNYKITNKKFFDIIKKIDNNIPYYRSDGGIEDKKYNGVMINGGDINREDIDFTKVKPTSTPTPTSALHEQIQEATKINKFTNKIEKYKDKDKSDIKNIKNSNNPLIISLISFWIDDNLLENYYTYINNFINFDNKNLNHYGDILNIINYKIINEIKITDENIIINNFTKLYVGYNYYNFNKKYKGYLKCKSKNNNIRISDKNIKNLIDNKVIYDYFNNNFQNYKKVKNKICILKEVEKKVKVGDEKKATEAKDEKKATESTEVKDEKKVTAEDKNIKTFLNLIFSKETFIGDISNILINVYDIHNLNIKSINNVANVANNYYWYYTNNGLEFIMYIDVQKDELKLTINNYKKEPDQDIFNFFKKNTKYFSPYPKKIGLHRYIMDNNDKNILETISNYHKCYNKMTVGDVNVTNNNILARFLKLQSIYQTNLQTINILKEKQDLSLYQYIYYIEDTSLKNIPNKVTEETLKKIIKPINPKNKTSRKLSGYIYKYIQQYYIALLEYDIIKPLNELDINAKYKQEVDNKFTLIYE